jgi:hypothetical protein
MIVVLTLVVLAATLGAGGYLAFRKITAAIATVASALGATLAPLLARKIQYDGELVVAVNALRQVPRAATIARADDARLLAVHDMHCIVGTETCQPGQDQRIIVAPVRADMFQIRALRIVCHAAEMPALEQRVCLLVCEINQCPQTQWSNGYMDRNPKGVLSDVYAAPAGFAVGVQFAVCTTESLIQRLEFVVRNDNPYPVRVVIEGYGEPVDPAAYREHEPRVVEGP